MPNIPAPTTPETPPPAQLPGATAQTPRPTSRGTKEHDLAHIESLYTSSTHSASPPQSATSSVATVYPSPTVELPDTSPDALLPPAPQPSSQPGLQFSVQASLAINCGLDGTDPRDAEILTRTPSQPTVANGPLPIETQVEGDISIPNSSSSDSKVVLNLPSPSTLELQLEGKGSKMSLRDEIAKLSKKNLDTKLFLPADVIDSLRLQQDRVEGELGQLCVDPGLLEYVMQRAFKIFLTLVQCGRKDDITQFNQSGFSDEDFPFFPDPSDGGNVIKSRRPSSRALRLPAWGFATREEFLNHQWRFLAPVFTAESLYHKLDAECPIPIFNLDPPSPEKVGLFGSVREIQLHSSHQKIFEQVCCLPLPLNLSCSLQLTTWAVQHAGCSERHQACNVRIFQAGTRNAVKDMPGGPSSSDQANRVV